MCLIYKIFKTATILYYAKYIIAQIKEINLYLHNKTTGSGKKILFLNFQNNISNSIMNLP